MKIFSDEKMEHQSGSMVTRNDKIRFRVRQMTIEDVTTVLEIWAKNNLHEGTQTIQSFMVQDPEGFIVAEQIYDPDDDDLEENPNQTTDNDEDSVSTKKSKKILLRIFNCFHIQCFYHLSSQNR